MGTLTQVNEEPSSQHSDVILHDRGVEEGRSAGILGLSNDILYLIFDYFRTKLEWLDNGEGDKWQVNRQASRASRLVCHRFCAFATPVLFESLTIDLDAESVRRAETLLTQNPLIAASVRTIEVSLACRDPDQARDLLAFIEARNSDLQTMLAWYDEELDIEIEGWDKDVVEEEFIKLEEEDWYCRGSRYYDSDWMTPDAFEACRNYLRMRDAFIHLGISEQSLDLMEDHAIRGDAAMDGSFVWEMEREMAVRRYQQLFKEGYTLHNQKLQEQLQIIQSGSFAQAVARCITKLKHKGFLLSITNKPLMKIPWDGGLRDAGWHINNNERLLRVMSGPHHWHWQFGGSWNTSGKRQPSTQLLTEIPVACYQTGVPVLNLKLECFPMRGRYSDLFPFSSTLKSMEEWSVELGVACQQIQSFEMENPYDDGYPRTKDASIYVDTFMSAMLSGGRLERFRVRTNTYDLGHVYATAASTWTRLYSLDVGWVGASQGDVETMCRNLVDGARFNHLMFSVWLQYKSGWNYGSWANALDILREKLPTRWSDGLTGMRNFHLKGGELDDIYVEARACRHAKRYENDSDMDYAEVKQLMRKKRYRYSDEYYDSAFGLDYDTDCEYERWGFNTERTMNALMEDNLMDLVQCYVSGDARVSENPLRGDREALCERIIRWRKDLFLPEDDKT